MTEIASGVHVSKQQHCLHLENEPRFVASRGIPNIFQQQEHRQRQRQRPPRKRQKEEEETEDDDICFTHKVSSSDRSSLLNNKDETNSTKQSKATTTTTPIVKKNHVSVNNNNNNNNEKKEEEEEVKLTPSRPPLSFVSQGAFGTPDSFMTSWIWALQNNNNGAKQEEKESDNDDYDDSSLDSDEELEQQALIIRSDLRNRELMELALLAEQAAEAGQEKFTGQASTFGDALQDDDLKPIRFKRTKTYTEGANINNNNNNQHHYKTSSWTNRRPRRATAAAANFLSERPSLGTHSRIMSLRRRKKIPVMALRNVNEVIPPLADIHQHLKTHLSFAGVDTEEAPEYFSKSADHDDDDDDNQYKHGDEVSSGLAFLQTMKRWVARTTSKSPTNNTFTAQTLSQPPSSPEMSEQVLDSQSRYNSRNSLSSEGFDIGDLLSEQIVPKTFTPNTNKRLPVKVPPSLTVVQDNKNTTTTTPKVPSQVTETSDHTISTVTTSSLSDQLQQQLPLLPLPDTNSSANSSFLKKDTLHTPVPNHQGQSFTMTSTPQQESRTPYTPHMPEKDRNPNNNKNNNSDEGDRTSIFLTPLQLKETMRQYNHHPHYHYHRQQQQQHLYYSTTTTRGGRRLRADSMSSEPGTPSFVPYDYENAVLVKPRSDSKLFFDMDHVKQILDYHSQNNVKKKEGNNNSVPPVIHSPNNNDPETTIEIIVDNNKNKAGKEFVTAPNCSLVITSSSSSNCLRASVSSSSSFDSSSEPRRPQPMSPPGGRRDYASDMVLPYINDNNNGPQSPSLLKNDHDTNILNMLDQEEDDDENNTVPSESTLLNPIIMPQQEQHDDCNSSIGSWQPQLKEMNDIHHVVAPTRSGCGDCGALLSRAASVDDNNDIDDNDSTACIQKAASTPAVPSLRRVTSCPSLDLEIRRVTSCPSVADAYEMAETLRALSTPPFQVKSWTNNARRNSIKKARHYRFRHWEPSREVTLQQNHAFLSNYMYCSKQKPTEQQPAVVTEKEIQSSGACGQDELKDPCVRSGCDAFTGLVDTAIFVFPKQTRSESSLDILDLNGGDYHNGAHDSATTWFDAASERFDGAIERIVGSTTTTTTTTRDEKERRNRAFQAPTLSLRTPKARRKTPSSPVPTVDTSPPQKVEGIILVPGSNNSININNKEQQEQEQKPVHLPQRRQRELMRRHSDMALLTKNNPSFEGLNKNGSHDTTTTTATASRFVGSSLDVVVMKESTSGSAQKERQHNKREKIGSHEADLYIPEMA